MSWAIGSQSQIAYVRWLYKQVKLCGVTDLHTVIQIENVTVFNMQLDYKQIKIEGVIEWDLTKIVESQMARRWVLLRHIEMN